MVQLSVSLPADLQHYVEGRASAAGFANPADYLRDLIERDQDAVEADVGKVRALVQQGIASGIIDREPEDVLDEVIAEILADDD
ncbi:MAG TPA: type II toxin-antitoxin system ParD family antitoxin [Sphingomonas sp.]|jgi:antitoxin ParD1/3/4|nr:type II toxin-antitoxin system ParD family antitoxin [Sphingomonas sp.]